MNRPRDTASAEAATRLPSWDELNRRWLIAALARLSARIEAQPAGPMAAGPFEDCVGGQAVPGFTPALVHCARTFGLSVFERELLLLAAGLELDQRLRAALAAREPGGTGAATFGLALGLLAEPHWDALSPAAPLRRWRMLLPEAGAPLTGAALRIDERILHFVAGIAATDAGLAGIARRLPAEIPPDGAPEVGDPELAGRIARALSDRSGAAPVVAPVVALFGGDDDPAARRDLALAVAAELGASALWIAADELPAEPEPLERIACHLDREAALTGALPVVSVETSPDGAAAAIGLARRLCRPFLWLGTPGERLAALPGARPVLRFEMPRPDSRRTRELLAARWRRAAPGRDADDTAVLAALDRAAGQFRLGPAALDGIAERLRATPAPERPAAVWPAARAAARGGLDTLAQRIDTRVAFDDLVLPTGQTAMLRDIARQLRHRDRVFADWGFGAKHRLGQGLVALFAGESGTGKTLAAEAIANEVALDLYRVDLATLVSKYIGETEKNLKRLFDAAETSGAVLLFDEADALFGKRSEVKDSHDRYANIEVAYLLQRVEAYRGLAVLTTNMRAALDRAFLRRIRFIVAFPFPDAAAREQIWRRQIPAAAPTGAIDFAGLARLNLSGGNIRSVALAAAFKAADRGVPIDQALLVEAAREEFAKLGRPTQGLDGGT